MVAPKKKRRAQASLQKTSRPEASSLKLDPIKEEARAFPNAHCFFKSMMLVGLILAGTGFLKLSYSKSPCYYTYHGVVMYMSQTLINIGSMNNFVAVIGDYRSLDTWILVLMLTVTTIMIRFKMDFFNVDQDQNFSAPQGKNYQRWIGAMIGMMGGLGILQILKINESAKVFGFMLLLSIILGFLFNAQQRLSWGGTAAIALGFTMMGTLCLEHGGNFFDFSFFPICVFTQRKFWNVVVWGILGFAWGDFLTALLKKIDLSR